MNALLSIAVLSLLLALIYGPWQAACTDWARERIFASRDAIFDLAANGEMDFNDSEYRNIRQSLESLIRFAHLLTFPRFLFMTMFAPPVSRGNRAPISVAIGRIRNPETRSKVQQQVASAQNAITVMLIMKSPVAMVFIAIAIPLYILATTLRAEKANSFVTKMQTRAAERVEAEAACDDVAHAKAA